jgi:hypothetical protein
MILWGYGAYTTKGELLSSWNDSKYGVRSGCRVFGPSNLPMTGMVALFRWFDYPESFHRVGVTVCKWLFQSVHDTHAISAFDYILPLMVYDISFTFTVD